MWFFVLIWILYFNKTFSNNISKITKYKCYAKNILLFENNRVDEYLNIPYAQSPVGKLRFLPPKSLTTHYFFPNKPSFLCPQMSTSDCKTIKGENISENIVSENCLVLNIWQPKKTKGGVLVIFHSGSFPSALESLKILNGSIFSHKTGLIVVTISYRTGVLGFARLYNDELISGNMGLLDQHMGLKWVHENIKYFNGNPNKVTIFGEGVGSIQASAHLYSEESSKYFQKIILFPGHASKFLNIQKVNILEKNTAALLDNLNCNNKNYGNSLECLQNAKISDIFKSVEKIKMKLGYFFTSPFVLSQEDSLFFKKNVEQKIINGSFKRNIDIIIGSLTNKNLSFIINHFLDFGCYNNPILSNVHCYFSEEQSYNIFNKVIHKMLQLNEYKKKLKHYIQMNLINKIKILASKYLSSYSLLNFTNTFTNNLNGKIQSFNTKTKLKLQEYPFQDEITSDGLLKYILGFYFKDPTAPIDENKQRQQNFSLKIMTILSQLVLNGNINVKNLNLTKASWENEKINPRGIVINNFL